MNNKAKKKILVCALAVFILACLFPPWHYVDRFGRRPAGYSFLFVPPSGGGALQIDFGQLFIEWAALAAITGLVWILFVKPPWLHDDRKSRSQKFTPHPGNPEN